MLGLLLNHIKQFLLYPYKGIYLPSLGYDVQDRALVINPSEQAVIEHIFQRFVVLGSVTQLAHELNPQGYRTKILRTKTGHTLGGKPFSKGTLYRLLHNPLYVGQVRHKGQCYEGRHQGIIHPDLWDQVQATFRQAPRRHGVHSQAPTLLQGILRCQRCDVAMTPVYTRKKQRHDRYYVCSNKYRGLTCPEGIPGYLAAHEVEDHVVRHVRHLLQSPEIIAQTHRLLAQQGPSTAEVVRAFQDIETVWQHVFPAEQKAIIHTLVRVVWVSPEGIEVRIRTEGLPSLACSVPGGDSASTCPCSKPWSVLICGNIF